MLRTADAPFSHSNKMQRGVMRPRVTLFWRRVSVSGGDAWHHVNLVVDRSEVEATEDGGSEDGPTLQKPSHPEPVEGVLSSSIFSFTDARKSVHLAVPGPSRTKTLEIGEVAEWSKAAVSKTVIPFGYLGFESLPLRHEPCGSTLGLRR